MQSDAWKVYTEWENCKFKVGDVDKNGYKLEFRKKLEDVAYVSIWVTTGGGNRKRFVWDRTDGCGRVITNESNREVERAYQEATCLLYEWTTKPEIGSCYDY